MAIEEVQAKADGEWEKEAKEPYTSFVSRCSQYICGREKERRRLKERERETIRQGNFANGDGKKSKFKYKLLQQETELSPPGREQQLPLGVGCCLKSLQNMNMLMVPYMNIPNGWRSLISTGNWRTFATCFTIETIPFPSPSQSYPNTGSNSSYMQSVFKHRKFTPGIGSRQTQTWKPFSGPKCNHRCETAACLGGSFSFCTASAMFLSLSISESPSCSNRLVPVSPMSFLL